MSNSANEKWLVILNPHAGSGRGKKDQSEIEKYLHRSEINFELKISEFPKHTIALTIEAIENGYRKLIVAGGDGTLNEAVNGIFIQTICPPEQITIGVIPVGTGNDWIKTFGIPNNYRAAIQIIKSGFKAR
jgi:diacylglycerol kinase family enzyme